MELQEFELILTDDEGVGMNLISIVYEPANDSEALMLSKQSEVIQFASNEERQMLYGAILIPDQKILRVPEKGDPYYVTMSADTIRQIAYRFNREGKLTNIDYDHSKKVEEGIALVENWIVEESSVDKSKALGLEVPNGTWFGGTHVESKEKWEALKLSKRTGFSVDGVLMRKPKQEDPIDLLMSIVKDLQSED